MAETKLSEKEIEAKVIELAKSGMTNEKIGLELKKLGAKPSDYKKRIAQILKPEGIAAFPDRNNIRANLERLKKHIQVHKQDKTSGRSLAIKVSKLRKLEKATAQFYP